MPENKTFSFLWDEGLPRILSRTRHPHFPVSWILTTLDKDTVRHPTQIYEGVVYLIIFFLLYRMYWREKGKVYQGLLISIFLILVFTARFLIEFLKETQVDWEKTMKLDFGINMGQALSIPFILLGVAWLIWSLKKKTPGFVEK